LSATDRPSFRTDLVSRPIEAAGHRFIEVTDPDSGHSFRFYEVEYAIACAMDGERDLDELADWAKIELGVDPSSDELRTVISTLGDLGYLDGSAPPMTAPSMTAPGASQRAASEPPAPLDRPPPAGRPAVSPFDLPRDRAADELSTDLSDHLPVRAADVKEAVRQSRAMQAQKPAAEIIDDDGFDDQKTPAPMRQPVRQPSAAAALNARAEGGSASPALSAALGKTLLGTAAPAPAARPPGRRTQTPPPTVLPDTPTEISSSVASAAPAAARQAPNAPGPAAARHSATARDSQVQPMLPARRSGGLLPYLVVLLLLSAAGAAAYWWFFVRQGEVAEGSSSAPPIAPNAVEGEPGQRATTPTPEQPAPAEITATLEAGPTQEQEVKAPRLGVVAWLAAAGTEVSEGAPVAKFDGYQRWDYAVKEAQESQRRYQEKLDQATAKGDKEAMKEAEANVKRKQGDIDRNTEELDKFLIKAPIGGVVEPAIKQRAQVKKDEPVAKILAQSVPRATFALPPGTSHAGSEARVVARSDPGLAATCKVESADAGKLVVACPTDSGLASGTEVILKLP